MALRSPTPFLAACAACLSLVGAGCVSVPIAQRGSPAARLKGIEEEAKRLHELGQAYWSPSGTVFDKNRVVRELGESAETLGGLAREDADAGVRAAADRRLAELARDRDAIVRLVALRAVQDPQALIDAALNDDQVELRSLAISRLEDPATLQRSSQAQDVAGRVARIRYALIDPALSRALRRQPSLSVDSEVIYSAFNEKKREGCHTKIEIALDGQVIAQGVESAYLITIEPVASHMLIAYEVGYPLGAGRLLAKIAKEEAGSAGRGVERSTLDPVALLTEVLSKSSVPADAAADVARTARSADLRAAALRHSRPR